MAQGALWRLLLKLVVGARARCRTDALLARSCRDCGRAEVEQKAVDKEQAGHDGQVYGEVQPCFVLRARF
jgi:hypothetical protein